MRFLVQEAGLAAAIEVDSAGTAAYHSGEPPDRRSTRAALARGVTLSGRARQFQREDFERFDYVVAMDRSNFDELAAQVSGDRARKVHLLRSFDPESPEGASVPDPYYGGERGFAEVVELCFAGCRGLIEQIRREHAL